MLFVSKNASIYMRVCGLEYIVEDQASRSDLPHPISRCLLVSSSPLPSPRPVKLMNGKGHHNKPNQKLLPTRQRIIPPAPNPNSTQIISRTYLRSRSLTTPIRPGSRPQRNKRCCMFTGKPHPALSAHPGPITQNLDISITLLQSDLEVAVRAVACVGVCLPLGSEKGERFAVWGCGRVSGEAGVEGAEEGVEEVVIFC